MLLLNPAEHDEVQNRYQIDQKLIFKKLIDFGPILVSLWDFDFFLIDFGPIWDIQNRSEIDPKSILDFRDPKSIRNRSFDAPCIDFGIDFGPAKLILDRFRMSAGCT